ncbi:MAG: sodium:alanine symporter family protein [Oscillospiraceae bacterium]|nr:sodium:alanine symporter family protein [Oscillospiraceae bacterium]
MNIIEKFIEVIYKIISGPYILLFLLIIGIYITFKTSFIQIFKLGDIWKETIGSLLKKSKKIDVKNITPFQAMSTALGGTMGVGNIVGIGTAMVLGGVGSIFWMWISAFFGMAVKYSEIVLSVEYRQKGEDGKNIGGPMFYLEKGLGIKFLSIIFSISCIIASFGIGNMTQINAISVSINGTFGTNKLLIGIFVIIIISSIIVGGVSRIGKFAEKIIPTVSGMYIIFAFYIIIINIQNVPQAFSSIFLSAFSFKSAIGGVAGYTILSSIKYGISRGIFSNEAGLGSSPIIHGASDTQSSVKQGFWGIFEVFIDTIVVCTITAIAIISSGSFINEHDGSQFTLNAFKSSFGSFGEYFIIFSIVIFAISSIISWCYYGERSLNYLTDKKIYILFYRIIFLFVILIGSVMDISIVWKISDIFNLFMMAPNVIGIILLMDKIVDKTKLYTDR